MKDWLLKLLGLNLKKPLEALLKLLLMLSSSKIQDEVKVVCGRMTAVRKKEVSAILVDMSKALAANDCTTFAVLVMKLLESVKFMGVRVE